MLTTAIINASLYSILFYSLWKKKASLTTLFVVGIWTFSAVLGIYYCQSNMFRSTSHHITLFPFIYLFICFSVLVYPLYKQNSEIITIKSKLPYSFIRCISLFFIIVSVLPFFELLVGLIKSIFNGSFVMLGANYDEISEGTATSIIDMSSQARFLANFSTFSMSFIPILIFYHLHLQKESKLFICLLFGASLVPVMLNIRSGSRTALLFYSLYFIALFLTFKSSLTVEIRDWLKKIIFIAGILFLLVFIGISFGRYTYGNRYGESSIIDYLYQYTSESMYNFNNGGFYENPPLRGDMSFSKFKIDLGISNIRDMREWKDMLITEMKERSYVFYSLIGDWYIDFGALGCFVFVLLVSLLFSHFYIGEQVRLCDFCLYGIFLYMMVNSLFYFSYKANFESIYTNLAIFSLGKLYSFINYNRQRE